MKNESGSIPLFSALLSGCLAAMLALPHHHRQEQCADPFSPLPANTIPTQDSSRVSIWQEPPPLREQTAPLNLHPPEATPRPKELQGITGTIRQSSLSKAFGKAGGDEQLARSFADLLVPRIDPEGGLAAGDRFSVLVEKYHDGDQFTGHGRILMARYEQTATGERLEAVYLDAGERSGYFTPDGRSLNPSFLPLPVSSAWIASNFSPGRRHPILGIVRPHLGVDLAALEGTPVMAAADGLVSFIGYNGGFGKQIVLKHGGGFRTHYGHLSRYQKGLKKGDRVKQQEIIGYVGATGLATGSHLDYRMELHGSFVDPLDEGFLHPPSLEQAELLRLQLSAEIYAMFMEDEAEGQVLAVREPNLTGPFSLLQGSL